MAVGPSGNAQGMTQNPTNDPSPGPDPFLAPDDPDTPRVDPDGDPEVLPPQDPLPEGFQQENAGTSLDQPSEGSR
jgi:hypothetical protein